MTPLFSSRQVLALAGPFIQLPYGTFSEIFVPSTGQLAVRKHF